MGREDALSDSSFIVSPSLNFCDSLASLVGDPELPGAEHVANVELWSLRQRAEGKETYWV